MEKHIELLGWKVKDKVTGFIGTVTHIGLDLYGCVIAIVNPSVTVEDNGQQKMGEGIWLDTARLDKIGRQRVMQPIPMKGELKIAGAEVNRPKPRQ